MAAQNRCSIDDAALNFLHQINNSNTSVNPLVSIFLDLSKAFDLVDHNILIDKLQLYGIRGPPIDLIKSYFKNRKQFTRVNKSKSTTEPIVRGVPQGSALGPLFFLIYINDIVKSVDYSKIILYADDIVVLNKNKDLSILKWQIERSRKFK